MNRNIFDKARDYYKRFGIKKTLYRIFEYSNLKIKNKYYSYIISKEKNDEELWEPLKKILLSNLKVITFIDVFHIPMGWETPLFQRFQHISLNVGYIGGMAFYGAHPTVDKDVKVLKKINDRLFLINFDNTFVKKKFFEILDDIDILKIIRLQSIDLATKKEEIQNYIDKGYHIVYEYIDELTPDITGYIPDFVFDRHMYLLKNENISIIATSEKLYEDVKRHRDTNMIMSCNGVDFYHWNNKNLAIPDEIKKIKENGLPIIGYHGALAKWIDYELIKKIAELKKYNLLLIGYEHDLSLSNSGLKNNEFVHFLGPRPYKELNKYCRYYDIAIIPFQINSVTEAVSPVKLFEYMASDKPIVTYGLRECKKYKSCIISENMQDFINNIQLALEKKDDINYLEILKFEALSNTWKSKTQEMIDLVNNNIKNSISVDSIDLTKAYVEKILKISEKNSIDFISITDEPYRWTGKEPKIIAYYLPQFYPFKENDEWWGKGTTEWNNVSRAIPQYIKHYQPRFPGELGYYDLRLEENIIRQVELAKIYGIYGFAYYYYWFNGKRLLDRPLDMLVNNKDIDMPFCLCWANENWTKKFDGTNSDVIMEQPTTIDSYKDVIDDIIKYMKDDRYIKIKGKNLLIIYRPSFIPDFDEVISYWRKTAVHLGIGDLYIMGVKENTADLDLISLGFDAVTEFHPGTIYRYCKDITNSIEYIRKDFNGQVLDYKDIVENKKYFNYNTSKLYRSIMPMWDNTARRNNSGMIFENTSPELYGRWLDDILKESKNKDLDESMIFINAWNEWGEGAYMEPDKRYGYAYLDKTKEVLENL